MRRRSFIGLCGLAATAGLEQRLALAAREKALGAFARTKLVDANGEPLKAKSLSDRDAYVFHYPFQGTPCFLIKLRGGTVSTTLSTEQMESYRWNGGVGPERNIVAFSAICAHQLTHPSKRASALNYYAGKNDENAANRHAKGTGYILCCAHGSVYDPAQGAKNVGGPATQPLAMIALEYDATTDELHANGAYGGAMFESFFRAFDPELVSEFGPDVARKPVADTVTAVPMTTYTKMSLRC
jgi:arsenite oxidase small subunit